MGCDWIGYRSTYIGYEINCDSIITDEEEDVNSDSSDYFDYDDERQAKNLRNIEAAWNTYLLEKKLTKSLNMCKELSFFAVNSTMSGTYQSKPLESSIIFGYELIIKDAEHNESNDEKSIPDEVKIAYKFPNNCLNMLTDFILSKRKISQNDSVDKVRSDIKSRINFGFHGDISA